MGTNRSLQAAQALQRQGRTAEAEALYRELLHAHPDALEIIEALAVLVFQQGRAGEAAHLFARVVALRPGSARSHANLGEALRRIGRLDQALENLHRAAALDPSFPQSWNSLGLLAFDQGRLADAERAYRESIRLGPRFAAAYINLGNTLHALGRAAEATESLRAALRIEPKNPLALVNLATVLSESRDRASLDEAEAVCRQAVALAPQLPQAVNNLERVLRLKSRAVELDHESAESHFKQGVALLRESRHTDAETCFREALRVDPTLATAWVGLSQLQAERGDIDASCESARSALAKSPTLAEAHWRLAITLKGRLPDAELQAIERLALDQSLPEKARAFLYYGLAAVCDDRGLYWQAAAHGEAASALDSRAMATQGRQHDPDADARFIDQMIAAFDAELFVRMLGWVKADPRPVFVVGLQRSGTSLVEQILASHPQIHGAGELRDVGRIFEALPEFAGPPSRDSFDALKWLNPDSAKAAAGRYLEQLATLAPPTTTRVVDKMPDNIRFLGLIGVLWPGARVILCRRDLRDIAISCWQTGYAFLWSKNWDHIAQRFAVYQRIADHWRRTKPLDWHEVSYENLVGDLEPNARRLIDFVGLEWDPSCLQFHSTRRVVRTPSMMQVRQPIHSGSLGRWRKYEASLQPAFRAFERYGVEVK
jgi:tetratricopeptide (TPR) repeat protein